MRLVIKGTKLFILSIILKKVANNISIQRDKTIRFFLLYKK